MSERVAESVKGGERILGGWAEVGFLEGVGRDECC